MRVSGAALRKKHDTATAVDAPDPAALLAWYDRHHRRLPWRAPPGERMDAYRVWLSEIMLQQTTVKAVGPYYSKFLARWPDVASLAKAPLEEVLKAWAGLGYYARARNLHACAKVVAAEHDGKFPDHENGLRELPGRHIDVLVDRLGRAVDEKMPAAATGVPEIILRDRVAVGVAGGEQRGRR